jgi:hypothetical protein
VEANQVRALVTAEPTVKAKSYSSKIPMKQQRARSGDVGIAVAVDALSPVNAPEDVRIAP